MSGNRKWFELPEQFRGMFTVNVMVVLVMMGMGVIVPVLPLYGKSFGVSTTMVGFLIASFGLARLVVDLPAGFLIERYGRKIVLVWGTLLLALGSLFCGLTVDFWQLLFWRFVQGAGSALYTTAAMTLVADMSTKSNRGQSMALFQGSMLIGSGLGPSLGGFIAERLMSFRAPFFVFALLAFMGSLWIWLTLSETSRGKSNKPLPGEEKAAGTSIWMLLGNISFFMVCAVNFTVFFTRAGARMDLVPLVGSDQVGLGPDQIGVSLTLAAAVDIAVLPLVGWLSDKYGRKSVIIPANLITAFSLVFLAFSDSYLFYLAGVILFGVSSAAGGTLPAAYAADIVSRKDYGLTMGLLRTFGDVGFVVAPVLLGWLVDIGGYAPALYFNAALMVAGSIAFGLWAGEKGRKAVKAG